MSRHGRRRPTRYVVIVLAVANLLSSIDRKILNLLMPAIKTDFVLSDTQQGLLQGGAFGLIHTLAILPLGWLADRVARNRIVTIGIMLWSLMTAGCGLARDFVQLFVARMAVGVGEASLSSSVAPLSALSYAVAARARRALGPIKDS